MDGKRLLRRSAPALIVLGLLAFIMIVASVSDTEVTRVPGAQPKFDGLERQFEGGGQPLPQPTGSPGALDGLGERGEPSPIPGIVMAILVVAGTGLILWFVLTHKLRWRHRSLRVRSLDWSRSAAPVDPEQIRYAVQVGLDELDDQSADPRRAVIACWLRLESAAASAGTQRGPGDTPTDLVTRMLAAHQVSGALLHRLAAVYRRARYAPAAVDEGMRAEARETLERLRIELLMLGPPDGADARSRAESV